MIDQSKVFATLENCGVDFFVGVPDSYLNGFCEYALSRFSENTIVAANEGNAIGIASGYYFATGKLPLVYMQNSGLGNAINPLVSLADRDVYAVPMVLLVGWRGQGDTEPNHPQHSLQGKITLELLDIMNIPYSILDESSSKFDRIMKRAVDFCMNNRRPYGLIAPKGVMAETNKTITKDDSYPLSREEAIEIILDIMPHDTIYVATTGRATRELYYLREKRGERKDTDFLNVGAMGHASSVGFGIARARPERKVVVLDGDSAAIMHLGAMTMMCKEDAPNLMHVILNNGSHDSVGGQPSVGHLIDFTQIAASCGYHTLGKAVENKQELVEALEKIKCCGKTSFIDCRIHKGLSRKLPPIIFDHRQAIDEFMDNLRD